MAESTAATIRGVLDWVETVWIRVGLLTALVVQVILLNDLFKRSGVEAAPGLETIYTGLVVVPLLAIGIQLGLDTADLLIEWKSQTPTEA